MKFLRMSLLPAAIALSAVFLALPTTGAPVTVHIVRAGDGWRFDPPAASLRAGKKIAFTNDTTTTHTATCDTCGFDTRDIQPGQTAFITLRAPGTLGYHCNYHAQQGMTGKVTVS